MNTSQIVMEPEAAEKKLKEFRRVLGRTNGAKLSAEVRRQYESARAAYRALSKGTPLIDLTKVLSECPLTDKQRPKLAFCRADARAVRFEWNGTRAMTFIPHSHPRRGAFNWNTRWRFELLEDKRNPQNAAPDGFARVPLIPADVRPATGKEEDWFILWEVEKWANSSQGIFPDRDPYLLKHLGGSLYAILAEWDLTELEQAIMRDMIR